MSYWNPFKQAKRHIWDHRSMKDRGRHIWLPAQMWTAADGAPALAARGAFLNYAAWALDAATTESVVTLLMLPAEFSDSSLSSVTASYAASTAAAGNILFRLGYLDMPYVYSGEPDLVPSTFDVTVGAVGANMVNGGTFASPSLINNGPLAGVVLKISRIGGDAADTYGADVNFLGLRLTYNADM